MRQPKNVSRGIGVICNFAGGVGAFERHTYGCQSLTPFPRFLHTVAQEYLIVLHN